MLARDYTALTRFIAAHRRTPFAWDGVAGHDCCVFAFGGVLALTGIDHWAAERPRYRSERGALRVIARHGGMAGIVDARLTPINPAMAQRGDVGLVKNHEGADTLCLVEGDLLWMPGPDALVRHPRRLLLKAWDSARPVSEGATGIGGATARAAGARCSSAGHSGATAGAAGAGCVSAGASGARSPRAD